MVGDRLCSVILVQCFCSVFTVQFSSGGCCRPRKKFGSREGVFSFFVSSQEAGLNQAFFLRSVIPPGEGGAGWVRPDPPPQGGGYPPALLGTAKGRDFFGGPFLGENIL